MGSVDPTPRKRPLDVLAKILRILTLAPLVALFVLLELYLHFPELLGGIQYLVVSIVFLVVFPLLAYPLQPIIPYFKDRGRDGQRSLAMLFAVGGYALGFVTALLSHASQILLLLYLDYLLTATFLLISDKVFHLKASGHAAGATGPFFILIYFLPSMLIACLLMMAAVFWSSLHMKRHTIGQLFGGIGCTLLALVLSLLLCGFAL